MDKAADLMVELLKAERDKCLIETLKESALHPDRPIEITKQTIKLTNEELEEIFDKIDASDNEREIWKKVYYNEDSN